MSRLTALAIPLLIVVGVRYLAPEAFENVFFMALTDTALLVAAAKLGVDVYLPSCATVDGRVVVSGGYRTAYALIVVALLLAAIAAYATGRGWQVALASAVVLCALALAEAGRLRGRFTIFYFLKAPSLYVGVLAICLAGASGRTATAAALLAVLLVAFAASRRFATKPAEIDTVSLAVGAIVSLLVVVFGWKEAAASRYLFDGDQLAELVMYSRFSLIVTFPFMLRNARVPLVMRASEDPCGAAAIDEATRAGWRVNILWAIGAGVVLTLYALSTEPRNAAGVAALMAGACVLVAFGNMGACLVFLRDYRALVTAHVIALAAFLIALPVSAPLFGDDRFMRVALASLIGQAVLGLMLRAALERWRRARESVPKRTEPQADNVERAASDRSS